MIDTDSVRTASLYINNQLLSRGLLQDGKTIDFANAGKDTGDAAITTGRIISVVNDLILRRDRDAEHRESLSTTMRSLRTENLKHTNEIARLKEKNTEAQRKLDIAVSSESSIRTQLKSADAAVRGLKEDIVRTKALVSQARASCATEVRRRDRQIDTLKKQLGEAGRPRGTRTNPAITTIQVTGDVGEERTTVSRTDSTISDTYSLKNETNSFLAKLSQNLSEENEALAHIMQQAMAQLREMSGYVGDENQDPNAVKQPGCEELTSELDSVMDHMRNILTNPSFVPIEEVMIREEEINRLKNGWVKMESRWEEAVHLIEGWRKRMAASGKPLCDEDFQMGLRLSPLRNNDEEARMLFGTVLSVVKEEREDDRPIFQASPCPPTKTLRDEPVDGYGESNSGPIEYGGNAHAEADEDLPALDATGAYQSEASADSSPLPAPPQLSPLRNSSSAGNRRPAGNGKQREKPTDFTTIAEENTRDLAEAGLSGGPPPKPPPHRTNLLSRPLRSTNKTEGREERNRSPSRTSLDDALLPQPEPEDRFDNVDELLRDELSGEDSMDSEPEEDLRGGFHRAPRRGPSRLPLPSDAGPASQQSPLTMSNIAAKLAASEREADAARVRAKLRAARVTGGVKRPRINARPEAEAEESNKSTGREKLARREAADVDGDDVDPVKRDSAMQPDEQLKPEKRKRDRKTSKAASRRRSTLSPWELESLISGSVQ